MEAFLRKVLHSSIKKTRDIIAIEVADMASEGPIHIGKRDDANRIDGCRYHVVVSFRIFFVKAIKNPG